MKPAFLTIGMAAFLLKANAAELTKASTFDSVEAFELAVKTFRPSKYKTDVAALFAPRCADPEDRDYRKLIYADTVQASDILWENDTRALVFATAKTPKDYPDAVGVLFLLKRAKNVWRIAGAKKFSASGKYAAVWAEQAAEAGAGYQLGKDGFGPVITVKESIGGRGFAYTVSASYIIDEKSKIKRCGLTED
jgi:hypothetical protein